MEKPEYRDEVVITQDKAVFWMDEVGLWHNRHGPFEHPKIIRYFNTSIQRDEGGYFVSQSNGCAVEKVYFPFVVTAFFVVDLMEGHPVKLKLNTRVELDLVPEGLFLYQEDLYYRMGNDIAKFNPHALLKISKHINHDGKRYRIRIGPERHFIMEAQSLESFLQNTI